MVSGGHSPVGSGRSGGVTWPLTLQELWRCGHWLPLTSVVRRGCFSAVAAAGCGCVECWALGRPMAVKSLSRTPVRLQRPGLGGSRAQLWLSCQRLSEVSREAGSLHLQFLDPCFKASGSHRLHMFF